MLRIPNVDRADEGRYVCTDDNGRMQYVKLVIAGKPIVNTKTIQFSCGTSLCLVENNILILFNQKKHSN